MLRPGLASLETVVDSLFLDKYHHNPAHDPFAVSFNTSGRVDIDGHIAFGRSLEGSQQVLPTDMDGSIEWDFRRGWKLNATYLVSDPDRFFSGIATRNFSVPTQKFNVLSFAIMPGGFEVELFHREEDTVHPVPTTELSCQVLDSLAWHAGHIISGHLMEYVETTQSGVSRARAA